MSKIAISLAGVDYDRTRAIFNGNIKIAGCETIAIAMSPEEAFHRAFRYQEFDVTELSLASYMYAVDKKINQYVAIPIFPSRLFRHSGIYVRTDRGIHTPEDLRGKLVGVPEYEITAAVWIRGILQDDYSVRPSDLRWRTGGLEDPGRREKSKLTLGADIEIAPIAHDTTLSEELNAGNIDAVISAAPPTCFGRNPKVSRLFQDYRAVEEAYFKRTGIFPIMHVVGIRKALAEQHPWLPVNVYSAYVAAKVLCYRDAQKIGHLYTTHPWAVHELERVRGLMSYDFWSYGVSDNKREFEAIGRYAFAQGLTSRVLLPADLFVASTMDLARN